MERLPEVKLPTAVHMIGDVEIPIKSLSRSQALKITTDFKSDVDGAEVYILACGTGQTEDAIREWRDNTDVHTVGALVDAIVFLSALATEGQPNPN